MNPQMHPLLRRLRAWGLQGGMLLALSCLPMPGLPSGAAASERNDPPARVGRLADAQGAVWMFEPQAGEWQAVQRNRPVTGGDRLSTEQGARAEMRIGPSVVRIDGHSELEVLQLDDQRVRLHLHVGSVALHLMSQDAARDFEVSTAQGRLSPQRDGHYRIDQAGPSTFATAWTGKLGFEASDSTLEVSPGQRVEFWRDGPTHYTTHPVEYDPFTNWARSRAIDDERGPPQHVSPEMTGWEDLDRHGRWETTPEHGLLWTPAAVAPDWVPYRHGRWVWIRPWGWTWVDDAPWGFAPFHYGRWVRHRNVWCWAPGMYVARPVYAPALVAWIGGPQASVSVTIGSKPVAPVGWFPLAPREIYVPGYRASPRHVHKLNAAHVGNVTVIDQTLQRPPSRYANRQFADAVTVVPADVLRHRQPVAPALIRGRDAQAWLQAGGVRHDVPVTAPALRPGSSTGASVPPAPWRRAEDDLRRSHRDVPQPARPALPPPRTSAGEARSWSAAPGAVVMPAPSRRSDERHDRGRHDERSRPPVTMVAPPLPQHMPPPQWSSGPPAWQGARPMPHGGEDTRRAREMPDPSARGQQGHPGWRAAPSDDRGHGRGSGRSQGPHPQDNRREQRQ